MKLTGVTSRGIIMPIFKQGDNLIDLIATNLVKAAENENFSFNDGDIIGVTEAVVARTQGNYATCEQIAGDIHRKLSSDTLGVVFPIMSRNRFSILLKAISMSAKNIVVQLSYPGDEVGNKLLDECTLIKSKVNPYADNFTEEEFRERFGFETKHPFTGIDYIEYYKSLNSNIKVVFSNDPTYILNYTNNVLVCDIHSRKITKALLKKANAEVVLGLDDILTQSFNGSGYNEKYGLYGSNMATPDKVKLFPRDCEIFVKKLQDKLREVTNKEIEILIYGDGCFKDPVGGIWELADPVVSPAFTSKLIGTPNEIKLKYFADNDFEKLSGEELKQAIIQTIEKKDNNLVAVSDSLGTTPRQLTDLIGSLCDLTSGSGDRGTPVILIQGYFSNYANS